MIALYFSYDGAQQGYRAYELRGDCWYWMGGFHNYVNPDKVRAYAEKTGQEIVISLPPDAVTK